ncbi:ML5 [Symbiodinium sp. CCMP2592]|nr:ML5 [Symbiodinium sp. CCMP2592]
MWVPPSWCSSFSSIQDMVGTRHKKLTKIQRGLNGFHARSDQCTSRFALNVLISISLLLGICQIMLEWSSIDGEADGLPKAETVQQFRLVSADLPLKVDRHALALDMKDELLPSLVYAEDLLSGPAHGMGRPRSVLDCTSQHEEGAEPMRVKMVGRSDEALDDIDPVAHGPELCSAATGHGPSDEPGMPAEWLQVTTIMMRNLPNKYTQRMLLMEVNHAGFFGSFDFFYLPIDTETGANRGYAFLNFLDPALAWTFRMMYEGCKMNRFNSSKIITIVPATLQGFEANYMHYAFARVSRGDLAARPLFLRDTKASLLGAQEALSPCRAGGRSGEEAWYAPLPMYEEANPMWSESDSSGTREDAEAPLRAAGYVPKFCSQCGGRIQLIFAFCPSCGQALDFS